jgi:hypothetical protein
MQTKMTSQTELLYRKDEEINQTKSFEYNKNDSKPIVFELLRAFSVKTNAKKIFETKCSDSSIQVFHGIRFLSMFWIIGGHSIAFAVQWMNFSENNNQIDIQMTDIIMNTFIRKSFRNTRNASKFDKSDISQWHIFCRLFLLH